MGFKSFFSRKKSKNKESRSDSSTERLTPELTKPSTSQSLKLKTQIEELEQVFKKFDVNGDGKISSSELGSIMSSLRQEASEEELIKMIKEFDENGDGFIDFKEFIKLNTPQEFDTEVEAMKNLKAAFDVYDMDGNGSISADELHKIMGRIGENCSIDECRKMISGVDSDGDGMIDFHEFKVMMTVDFLSHSR